MTISSTYLESTRARMQSKTRESNECLLWIGAVGHGGYGKLAFDSRVLDAHRVAWMLDNGPIPDGMVIAHRCDTPACVRTEHLFMTTQAGNLADMRAKNRGAKGPAQSAAIRAGLTPAVLAHGRQQQRARRAAEKAAATQAAGVPGDWKYCPSCATWKSPIGFSRNAARYDGLNSQCRSCRN